MYLYKQKARISACEAPSASNKLLYLILASRNMNNGLSHKRYTAGGGAKINLEYLCLLYQVLTQSLGVPRNSLSWKPVSLRLPTHASNYTTYSDTL